MSFPSYPSYKDSGAEWLGAVPGHWTVRRLGYFFEERRETVSDVDFEPLSVTKRGILPQLETAAKTDDNDNRKKVCKGDFVINSRSDRKGSAGLSDRDGSVSLINTVLEPRSEIHGSFAHYLLRSYPFQEEFYRCGKGIVADLWTTRYTEMREVLLAVPPLLEQQAIVAFLHREVGKIDALVADQVRLIELLKEKRQAVVFHAVTNGLDPDVLMKSSAIQWAEVVPTHWKICSLKRTFRSVDYGISDSLSQDGAVAILRMGNIQSGRIVEDDLKYVAAVPHDLLLSENDLLFNRTNSLDLIGKVGLVERIERLTSFASYLVRLRLNEDCFPRYFSYLLNTLGILGEARSLAFVAIGQCNLNPTRYGELLIALPPIEEQKRIVSFLDEVTGQADLLIDECQRAINLLQEHRLALISSAVTGEIDVRGIETARLERTLEPA